MYKTDCQITIYLSTKFNTSNTSGSFWRRDLREEDHLKDPGVDRIILKWIFKKWYRGAWTGFIWLRIGTGGGLLLMR
jgi:hypothetical protein